MNRKNILTTLAVSAILIISSGSALAGSRHHYDRDYSYEYAYDSDSSRSHRPRRRHARFDQARVVRVKPIYKTVSVPVTKRRCSKKHRRHVRRHNDDQLASVLIGGIVGGVLGNQFGSGGGKEAMTAVGAITGAALGHEMGSGSHRRPHRRCKKVTYYQEEERVVGYRVKYRYKGETYRTRTKQHPGKFIDVKVKVRPVEM